MMKKTKSLFRFFLFTLLVGSLFTFSTGHAEENLSEGESIKFGLTAALTGPLGEQAKSLTHGILAYFKKINAAGGVYGRKLELLVRDDSGDAKNTVELTKELIFKDHVFGLIGTYGAPNTSAVLPLIERADIPLVGPTTPMNYSIPVRKNVFMMRPSSENEDELLVHHLVDDLGITDVGVLFKDDALGLACRGAINNALGEKVKTVHITASTSYRQDSGDDIDIALDGLIAAKPRAVMLCARGPALISFIKKAVARGFNPVFIGNVTLSALAGAKPLEGLKIKVFATQASPLFTDTSFEVVKQYQSDMKDAGFTDFYSASLDAYISAAATVEALKLTGKTLTREAFRKALEKLDFTFAGIKIGFSPTDHQARDIAYLVQLVDGKLVSIKKMQ
jgi:branched-chain amino acid transport system substrate-binding protein